MGRTIKKLLEEISQRPELESEFRFFLYFKSRVPDFPFLDSPLFVKKTVKLPLLPSSFSLYYYLFLPIKLWFEKLDCVFFPNYMLPILFRGRSIVVLTEDIYYEISQGQLPLRYRLAYKIFAGWWAAKHATKIMSVSETSKREITKLFRIHPDRIMVNRLGINRPQDTKSKDFQLTAYGIRPMAYILYVGQAFPRRHLKETMMAFEKLAPLFPDLKFVAIGKDKYNPPIIDELKKNINRRLNREVIFYKDYVGEDELVSLYANAKLFVYISDREAFGLPPLEALSYSAPPVVAESELNHEIYNNKAFFVKSPLTVSSIEDALLEGLKNENKRRSIFETREFILENFKWSTFANRFLELVRLISK